MSPFRTGPLRPPREFIPAKPRRLLVHFLEHLNRFVLLHWLRIHVDLPEADLERLRQIPVGSGIIIASNHPTFADPAVVYEVTRRWGKICTYIAAREIFNKFGGWMGSLIRRAGAFSVFRGGANASAHQFATSTLLAGRFPIVIYPEGHTFYLNDVILPLKPGVAAWAVDAALCPAARPVYVVPLAIKYVYTDNIEQPLDQAVTQMERIVLKRMPQVPPGEFWSRLYLRLHRLAHFILARQERRHHYHPPHGADIDERVRGLCAMILRTLEIRYLGQECAGDFFDRARHLMARLKDDGDPQAHKDALDARFAWALSTFYAGYLSPDSAPERFADTVMKLQREITHRVPLTFRAWKTAHVRIGEPIAVHERVQALWHGEESERRIVAEDVLANLGEQLRDLVNSMQRPEMQTQG